MKERGTKWMDTLDLAVFVVISAAGLAEVLGYLVPGSLEASVNIGIAEMLMILVACAAWQGRMPFLLVPVAVFGCVLAGV